MTKAREILKNLTLNFSRIPIISIEDGIKKLEGKQKYLEAIHIYIEPFSSKLYLLKKKYFNISKVDKLTKLDEWIFKHLINEKEYRYEYLASYLKPIVTWDLGNNYPLDEKLREEIIINSNSRLMKLN